MSTWELCIIAVGLAMDAFAVSICKGRISCDFNFRFSLKFGFSGFVFFFDCFNRFSLWNRGRNFGFRFT